MNASSSPRRRNHALETHYAGAVFFLFITVSLAMRYTFTPLDLFIRHSWVWKDWAWFLVAGLIFYGFAFALLRARFAPNDKWGSLYVAGSWLLLMIAFYPTFSTGGMMRRIADPQAYEELRGERLARIVFTRVKLSAAIGFVLAQVAFVGAIFWRKSAVFDTPL